MKNKGQKNSEAAEIQGLLESFLRLRNSNNGSAAGVQHLDEDSLSAFVEGNLLERETKQIIEHLVDCSFCRHITSELIRLDVAFADDEIQISDELTRPAKISEVLNGLLSRIFGTNDGVVFAHEEKEEQPKEPEKEQ